MKLWMLILSFAWFVVALTVRENSEIGFGVCMICSQVWLAAGVVQK